MVSSDRLTGTNRLATFRFWPKDDIRSMRHLLRIELVAVLSLVSYAIVVSLLFAVNAVLFESAPERILAAMAISGGNTLILGFLPVVLYGAPIYCAHLAYPSFRFGWVLMLAILPGFLMLALDQVIGIFAIVGGIAVALGTKVLSMKWLRIEPSHQK